MSSAMQIIGAAPIVQRCSNNTAYTYSINAINGLEPEQPKSDLGCSGNGTLQWTY